MAGITPVSFGPTTPTPGITPGAAGPPKPRGQTDFGDALRGYINTVDKDQQASVQAIQDLMAGRTKDVLPAVAAVAKADMSFKLLIGIRNKVIDAYKQTLNMNV